MRVIGGSSRGRRLAARVPPGVRPTSDRVREAIFDILGSLGGVSGMDVVDLFCGSGALGVEALSRGAASVTFVDADPLAVAAVRENLATVGLASAAARPVKARLPEWLGSAPPVDLALCDPPYAFDAWHDLLARLQSEMAVIESRSPLDPEDLPPEWAVLKVRRYGGTLVTVLRHLPELPPTSEPGPS